LFDRTDKEQKMTKQYLLTVRYFFPMMLLVLLLFFLWQGLQRDPLQLPSPLLNKPMPTFTLASVENSKKRLTANMFFGHVSLLVVWSSWCVNCLAEHAFLLNARKDSRLQIIGLNYRDRLLSARHWLSQYGNPYYKVIFDPKGLLGMNLGVSGVPESFLLDEKGIIRYKQIGPLNEFIWNTEIEPRLGG